MIADNTLIRCGKLDLTTVGGTDAIIISNTVPPYTRKYRGLVVTGNVIEECARGIYVNSVRGATISGNTLSRLDGSGYTLADAEDVTLNVGSVVQCGGNGVVLAQLAGTSNKRITVANGRIHNFGHVSATLIDGVSIVQGTDILIDSLTITSDNGTARYGLFYQGGSAEQATLSLRNLTISSVSAQYNGVRLFNGGPALRDYTNMNVQWGVLYFPTAGLIRVGSVGAATHYLGWNATLTSGIFRLGDTITNAVPTVGQPKSWVCTTAGAGNNGVWVTATPYVVGDWRRNASGKVYECVVAGTSGATAPAGTSTTVVEMDGTVGWLFRSNQPAAFVSTGNL